MDPTVTMGLVRDTTLPLIERAEAAEALLHWTRKGGFGPEFVESPAELRPVLALADATLGDWRGW